MDGHRFDDITRSLAKRGSRRGFLAGTLGALAASIAAPGRSSAACPPEQVDRRGVGCVCKLTGRPPEADGYCPCPNGQTRCDAVCVELSTDPDNCGSCDAVCPDEGPCVNRRCKDGVCSPKPVADDRSGACPDPLVCCGGLCTDRGSDLNHCGVCGNVCGDGDLCTIDACLSGTCQYTAVDCTRGVCEIGTCNNATGDCDYDTSSLAGVTCREAIGACDLVESCDGFSGDCPPDQFQPDSVECRPASCFGGVAVLAANCPGTSGECPAEQTVSCGHFTCDDEGIACREFCERNSDCQPSAYCNNEDACVPDEPIGGSCEFDSQCQSDHCVDDICCQQDCPAPFGATASCADGVTCSWTCADGYAACGDACCPSGRTCCEGVCCGEGGTCEAGECTEFCRPVSESCGNTDECCLNEFIDCLPVEDESFDFVCCHQLGGACDGSGQCCLAVNQEGEQYALVACAPSGVCGGEGAECSADLGCTSGACCNGLCCGANQACGTDFVCRASSGTPCTDPGQCASGLCCGGVCVASNELNCAACGDSCGSGEVCASGVCLKDIGQSCTSGAQCAAGFCYDNVCCDECGELCGRPLPVNTPCGSEPGSYCCGGECINITPHWSQCGGCNIMCPFGDNCTENHTCTCTVSSSCPGSGPLDRHTCRGGGGLCVTSTEGDLACIWDSRIDPADSCDTTADCPTSLVCFGSGTDITCTNDWLCTKSTCYPFGVCALALPNGRPIPN